MPKMWHGLHLQTSTLLRKKNRTPKPRHARIFRSNRILTMESVAKVKKHSKTQPFSNTNRSARKDEAKGEMFTNTNKTFSNHSLQNCLVKKRM